jgi:hypothetical protein
MTADVDVDVAVDMDVSMAIDLAIDMDVDMDAESPCFHRPVSSAPNIFGLLII